MPAPAPTRRPLPGPRSLRPLPRPRRWRRWTLRSRLAVAAVGLGAVMLVAANAIGLLLLENYLVDRVDEQLAPAVPATSVTEKQQLKRFPAAQPDQTLETSGPAAGFLAHRYGGEARVYVLEHHPDGTDSPDSTDGTDSPDGTDGPRGP